ncbi:hypothetical protein QVD17_41154 [Tagetes erecta]|uniref:Uncharacterized protein n=1 Tax=Tagetes erecta TaxID=13708 RepID=A0AAD8JSR1_TARER|nr:hypothetical protein QVD17_41154 [Tagetes erecta]
MSIFQLNRLLLAAATCCLAAAAQAFIRFVSKPSSDRNSLFLSAAAPRLHQILSASAVLLPPSLTAAAAAAYLLPPLTFCRRLRIDVEENDIANKRKKASTSHTNDIIEPENQQHVTQEVENQQQNVTQEPENQQNPNVFEAPQGPKSNTNEVDLNNLERDPAKQKQMWNYPVDLREQVRRAYLSLGPFQLHLKEYPSNDT